MKKKIGGKPSAKGNSGQLKPRASGNSSGSLTIWHRAEGLFQDVLTASVVSQILGAVKRYNAVLANHMHGATFQSLQASQQFDCQVAESSTSWESLGLSAELNVD